MLLLFGEKTFETVCFEQDWLLDHHCPDRLAAGPGGTSRALFLWRVSPIIRFQRLHARLLALDAGRISLCELARLHLQPSDSGILRAFLLPASCNCLRSLDACQCRRIAWRFSRAFRLVSRF